MARPSYVTPAQARLGQVLARLDVENDDHVRADLIEEVFALCDRFPNLTAEARAYGIPAGPIANDRR